MICWATSRCPFFFVIIYPSVLQAFVLYLLPRNVYSVLGKRFYVQKTEAVSEPPLDGWFPAPD